MKTKAICVCNDSGYQYSLTIGKIYYVEKINGIFENRPFYLFKDDNGKISVSHLYRFEIKK